MYLTIRLQQFIKDTQQGFLEPTFNKPKLITKATSFAISSRRSGIWKNHLHESEKTILSLPLILNKLKN